MIFAQACYIKINLALRVFGRREDGYHDLHSLMWRRPSPEVLEIERSEEGDRLSVSGVSVDGENLLTAVCAFLRRKYGENSLPPIDMRLFKHIPTGSGVGAGSGNAASLLRWFFFTSSGLDFSNVLESCASLGMDIAFLASGFNLALADGRGESLKALNENLSLPGVVFFPRWRSGTSEAYALLDRWRESGAQGSSSIDGEKAESESMSVLRALKNGERAGLLPNDFASCASADEDRYDDIYDIFEKSGALAWGLCGSGSSCFVLFGEKDRGESIPRLLRHLSGRGSSRYAWIYKTLILE